MSYNADSLTVVNAVLQPLAPLNAQFPYLLYNNKNCTGQRYPAEGTFVLWNQELNVEQLGFDNIVSLYVPPHALLEMWSTGDQDGYYAVQGPTIISNTGAYLAFWHHYDNSACFPTEVHCGKRVGSSNGWRLGVDISRMRITWNSSWVRLLHDFASNQQSLAFGGTQYPVNNDALFNEICPHPYNRYSCNCHSAYQLIVQNHNQAANNSFVNVLQNGCDPNTMYVPSQGKVGAVTVQDCTVQINAQLKSGTFPTIENGGSDFYICSGHTYVNSYSVDAQRELDYMLEKQTRLKQCGRQPLSAEADENVTSAEPVSEIMTGFPTYAWYILGALLVVGVLLGVFYVLYVNRTFPFKSHAHPNLHRTRMQKAFGQ